ncbi:FliA/WhiG family RNA polymerase sigma factor [Rubrobacter indicoceani]|uniref:FliA/WhiG family RNA polymerase sigma factor n=1 Tax=Rubrobacter indicoceani TaxID=2051957 RepID=UPI000E5B8E9A|nr:FliA/WhiG family RNA polymerase sigma factor [Rubrobacter indicoceani]
MSRLWSSYAEARRELWMLLAADGASDTSEVEVVEKRVRQLKDRLVVNYSPLVKYAAGRVTARSTGSLDQEEILSWGIVGLLDAVETFDAGKGAKFETYAISKVKWAILDEMRRLDPLPRRERQRVRESQRARESLEQELRRAPTEVEVAEKMGVETGDHQRFLSRYRQSQTLSLESGIESGTDGGFELHQVIADHLSETPDEAAEADEMRRNLTEAIRNLAERERIVTTFYFYEGLTLREIGKALNLTEGRISQILRQALNKLRAALTGTPAS